MTAESGAGGGAQQQAVGGCQKPSLNPLPGSDGVGRGGGGLAKSYRGLSVQAKDKYGQISEHPQLDKGLWVQCN